MLRDHLGLHGLEPIEVPLLAALALSEPILVVGGHGAAKTTLCRRLARALSWRFREYDASKAMFEDVLGFPNPRSLGKGTLEYVPTPISIHGSQCVLIDEISRANPALQSKWLEVIRSRSVMGLRLEALEQVVCAMNPPTYLGAHPLDEALAGRFCVILRAPDVNEMSDADVLAVIRTVGEDDSAHVAEPRPEVVDGALTGFVTRTRRRLRSLSQRRRDQVVRYVFAFGRSLEGRGVRLDGRRMGMLARLLQACLCTVSERTGRSATLQMLPREVESWAQAGLPFAATGQTLATPLLRAAHEAGLAAAAGRRWARGLALPGDPVAAGRFFASSASTATPDERRAALTELIGRTRNGPDSDRSAALVGLGIVASAATCGALQLAPDDQFRLLDRLRESTEIDREQRSRVLEGLVQFHTSEPGRDVAGARTMTSLRLAMGTDPSDACADDVVRLSRVVEEHLRGLSIEAQRTAARRAACG